MNPKATTSRLIRHLCIWQCGSCWQLTYQGTSINVLAIDHTDVGFNIAQTAMNTLTNGQAQFLGRIDATAVQVDRSNCGL